MDETTVGTEIAEGFRDERLIILPESLTQAAREDEDFFPIRLSRAGYFPYARYHARRRENGAAETILLYCEKGEGWVSLKGNLHRVLPGDLVWLPAARAHAYGARDGCPWSLLWIHLEGRGLDSLRQRLRLSDEHPLIRVGLRSDFLARWYELIRRVSDIHGNSDLLPVNGRVLELLSQIPEQHRHSQWPAEGAAARVQAVKDMLEQGCQQSFTVTELARFAKLSSSRFAALFRQEVGCSPLQFQYACRMKRASELLKLTGLTVQEIAARVGYDDPLHFSRRFKAYFGKAPRFYRQVDSG